MTHNFKKSDFLKSLEESAIKAGEEILSWSEEEFEERMNKCGDHWSSGLLKLGFND